MDVFRKLKARIDQNSSHKECSSLCDAMSIKSFVYHNHSADNYNSYVNYGESIVAPEEDVVAKEAIVFILVSF